MVRILLIKGWHNWIGNGWHEGEVRFLGWVLDLMVVTSGLTSHPSHDWVLCSGHLFHASYEVFGLSSISCPFSISWVSCLKVQEFIMWISVIICISCIWRWIVWYKYKSLHNILFTLHLQSQEYSVDKIWLLTLEKTTIHWHNTI